MGRGWYCSDGVYVDGNTDYDVCWIHSACHVGVKFVQVTGPGAWVCNDVPGGADIAQKTASNLLASRDGGSAGASPAAVAANESSSHGQSFDPCFIHSDCHSEPGFSETGSMGRGWYCSDGVFVDGKTDYDACWIHSACHVGVKFVQAAGQGAWVCNDVPGGASHDG